MNKKKTRKEVNRSAKPASILKAMGFKLTLTPIEKAS